MESTTSQRRSATRCCRLVAVPRCPRVKYMSALQGYSAAGGARLAVHSVLALRTSPTLFFCCACRTNQATCCVCRQNTDPLDATVEDSFGPSQCYT